MTGGSLSTPEPQGLYYRVSVKCDRAMNAAIDKAAKAVGMTPTSFVQKHFEGILSASRQAAEPPSVASEADVRHDFDVAQSLGITVTSLRLYRVMDRAKDGNQPLLFLARLLGLPFRAFPVQAAVLFEARTECVNDLISRDSLADDY